MRGPGPQKSLSMIGTKLRPPRRRASSRNRYPSAGSHSCILWAIRNESARASVKLQTEPREAQTLPHAADLEAVEMSTGDRARKEQTPAMRR